MYRPVSGVVMLPKELLGGKNVPQELLEQPLWTSAEGMFLHVCTIVLALLLVLGLWQRFRLPITKVVALGSAALAVTAAVLFYVSASPATLRAFHSTGHLVVSPEEGRPRGGGVGVPGQHRREIVARGVGLIHARVGANESVPGLGDQNAAVHLHDAP